MNVADQLHRAARLYSERLAVRCGEQTLTFAQLESRTNRLANALSAHGLQQGDRVAIWLENSIRCVELDYALAKAGLVRVSLNPRLTPREAQFIVEDSDARALFWGASFDEAVTSILAASDRLTLRVRDPEGQASDAPPTDPHAALAFEDLVRAGPDQPPGRDIAPEDLYCLFYTSGTTGRPKGVMLSHRAMLHVAWNLLMEIGPLEIGEKILLMQPLSHGAGFFVLPQAIKGGCSIIMRHFDPAEVIRLAALHEIEVIKLIPTMLQRILRQPELRHVRLPALRALVYGASPMPAEPLRQAIEIFGPQRLVQIYGQSECPVTLSVLPASEHRLDQAWPERLLSAGRPWATVEMRVVDDDFRDVEPGGVGEIVLRGPQLMSGYWKRPDLTEKVLRDGWLKTQDMGRMDDHGYVYLLGRKDEMIISGGFNIAPREIEDAIYRFDGIQEAAVCGEPDPEWGQAVVAYVALRAGIDEPRGGLTDFLREELGFKRPKRIYRVAELPKNAAGKIQKSALRPQLALELMGGQEENGT
jgi:long-chain acyl-CoA synthetase